MENIIIENAIDHISMYCKSYQRKQVYHVMSTNFGLKSSIFGAIWVNIPTKPGLGFEHGSNTVMSNDT